MQEARVEIGREPDRAGEPIAQRAQKEELVVDVAAEDGDGAYAVPRREAPLTGLALDPAGQPAQIVVLAGAEGPAGLPHPWRAG